MSYDALSRYYDRLMGDFPYDAYLEYIAPEAHTKGLDLACGTGKMTRGLAAKGVQMHGVDLSPDMLNLAVRLAREQGLQITFGREDMRRFAPSHYDLICCVSDGLNYLPDKDLPPLLQRVASCLNEGGKFVFDVSTPYKLREVLGDNLFFEDYDDLTYYWQNKWVPKRSAVQMQLTFFEKEGELYRRSDETQTQYAHDKDRLNAAIEAAGLQIDNIVDGDTFQRCRSHSLRWVYTVRKR